MTSVGVISRSSLVATWERRFSGMLVGDTLPAVIVWPPETMITSYWSLPPGRLAKPRAISVSFLSGLGSPVRSAEFSCCCAASSACRASMLTESRLASITPMLACRISRKPPSTSTRTEAPNTDRITRRGSDCHHHSTGRRHQRRGSALSEGRFDTARPSATRRRSRRLARLVADAAHRHHDLRVLGVALDLRPQPLHVHVDQPGVGGVPVAPHLLQQHLAAEHLPGSPGQGQQQVELQWCELDGGTIALDGVSVDVDHQIADPQHLLIDLFGRPT